MAKFYLPVTTGILLILLFGSVRTADAQGQPGPCPPIAYFAPYWTSTDVFIGVVDKISTENDQRLVKFRVEDFIRGSSYESATVYTPGTLNGYPFTEGEHYYVYATRRKDGQLYADRCSSTRLLADAADDIEYARDIDDGKSGTRIYGSIHEDRWESHKTARQYVPLAGIEVTIRNKNNKFKTLTDYSGKYVFKNIPAGLYDVRADIPSSLSEKMLPAPYQDVRRMRALKAHQVYIGDDLSFDSFSSERKPFFRYWDNLDFHVIRKVFTQRPRRSQRKKV